MRKPAGFESLSLFFTLLINYLLKQTSATLWMPLMRGCPKVCLFSPIFKSLSRFASMMRGLSPHFEFACSKNFHLLIWLDNLLWELVWSILPPLYNSNKVHLIPSSWHLFNICTGGDVASDNFCNCLKHIIRQCALSSSSYLDNKDMQRSTAVWGERGQGGSVMPPVEAMTASFLPRLQVWPLNSSSFRRSHMSLFVSGSQ